MRICINVRKCYDFTQAPPGMEPTEADIKNGRVKPSQFTDADGKPLWQMRVTLDRPEQALICMSEGELAKMMIADAIRDRVIHTREAAIGIYVNRHVAPGCFHRLWITSIDCDAGTPEIENFRAEVDRHVAAGNLDVEDAEALEAAYAAPHTSDELSAYLTKHFRVSAGTTSATASKEES